MMFAQANSEHCRHKIFNASWTVDGADQPLSLFGMIRETPQGASARHGGGLFGQCLGDRGRADQALLPGVATAPTAIARRLTHILAKVETHNHPTAISPFPGAATGSGGEIRDEGATGRGSKPKAGLCGFSVSDLQHSRLRPAVGIRLTASRNASPRRSTS